MCQNRSCDRCQRLRRRQQKRLLMRPKKSWRKKSFISLLRFFPLLTTCIEFLNELVNLKAFLFITITKVFYTCAKFSFIIRCSRTGVLNVINLKVCKSANILAAHQTQIQCCRSLSDQILI